VWLERDVYVTGENPTTLTIYLKSKLFIA